MDDRHDRVKLATVKLRTLVLNGAGAQKAALVGCVCGWCCCDGCRSGGKWRRRLVHPRRAHVTVGEAPARRPSAVHPGRAQGSAGGSDARGPSVVHPDGADLTVG